MTWVAALRTAGAVAIGGALALTPFARYRWASAHPTAHMDHAPRHGGVLGMVGDGHLEIVRSAGAIACYASDARRRPLRPSDGRIDVNGVQLPTSTTDDRIEARDRGYGREITCTVAVDGIRMEMTADLGT